MKTSKWLKIRIVEDITKEKFKLGEEFLYGTSVTSQIETKKIKNEITYYKVTGFNGNNIIYKPVIDTLEEG